MSTREAWVRPLSAALREETKRAFSTRRVPLASMKCLAGGAIRPRSGDLVLARVERVGHHRRIEQPNGRKALLHLGDHIIVCYADRYATDQFESHVPFTLGPTSLVAGGGIASKVLSKSGAVRSATRIVPLGLVADERGRPLNVADFALPVIDVPVDRPRTFAVLGTSMNAGKTTTIRAMARGFAQAGKKPGVTKVTGTGSGNDYWVMVDAGAHRMLDFTDAGLAATFRQPIPRLELAFAQLVSHLTADGCGINFVEIADGILQRETASLLRSRSFETLVDGVVLAASDAMGAAYGTQVMRDLGINVVALSGLMTRSPLAVREATETTGLPVATMDDLMNPTHMASLLGVDMAPKLVVTPEPPAWPIEIDGLDAESDSFDRDFEELIDSRGISLEVA